MTSRLLTGRELAEAAAAFQRVFRGPRSIDAPFQDTMRHRRLGFPFWQHDLTRDQWKALVRALRQAGISVPFVFMRSIGDGRVSSDIWCVAVGPEYPFPTMIRQGWHGVFPSCAFSPDGEWGLAVDDEEFAFAGSSSQAFIAALRLEMAEFDDHALEAFLAHWAERLRAAPQHAPVWTWLARQLRHVYGMEAETLLKRLDLEPL